MIANMANSLHYPDKVFVMIAQMVPTLAVQQLYSHVLYALLVRTNPFLVKLSARSVLQGRIKLIREVLIV